MSACLTHVAQRLDPAADLVSDPLDRPVLGSQLLAELAHQPHRPSLLLRRVPTRRRLPRRPLVSHDSILVSKVWSLQRTQGDSRPAMASGHGLARSGPPVLADPNRAASAREVQCVEVSSGVSSRVTRTTSATVPSGSHDRRPRPAATRPTPSTPPRSKRRRHARTESSVVWHRRATSLVATPSAANNNALACTTRRCGNDLDRDIRSRVSRCSSVIGSGGALITGMLPP